MKNPLRFIPIIVICLSMCAGVCFAAAAPGDMTGELIWYGVLKTPVGDFRMTYEVVYKADGSRAALATSIDQNGMYIPVDEFSLDNGTARFVIKAANAVIEGPINADDLTIDARFKQGSSDIPIVLKKVDEIPVAPRPQEPVKPYPYREEAVVFENPGCGVKLSGTLTLPESKGPHPAVLLVAGSGPLDRNEKAFCHKPFLVLADYLTRNGFAVLRYDKRGVYRSTGSLHSTTTSDYAGDALAGIRYLKSRSDIDPGKVGLIGHSEGALIAVMLASRHPDVDFIVMLAGPGVDNCECISLQNCAIARVNGMSEADVAIFYDWIKRYHLILKEEKNDDIAQEKLLRLFDTMTEEEKRVVPTKKSAIHGDLSPWFREFIAGDPRPDLRKITCPVLALNGEKDVQVPPRENLRGIEECLKEAGNTRFTVKEMPNLNHAFQTAQTGAVKEYKEIEETMSPLALETIGQWMKDQAARLTAQQ
jgi:pimeloyl-ACP methyl ester carboxylesterase